MNFAVFSQPRLFISFFTVVIMRDDTLVSGSSFLRGNLKVNFSMQDHACCNLASDWLLSPSLVRNCESFFHLQLTLGRGNISERNLHLFFILFILFLLLAYLLLFLRVLQACFSLFYTFNFSTFSLLCMERKKYNLRSSKSESNQIPLELHLSDDNDFVMNLLGHKKNTMSHQDSDSSLSGSELDCDTILHSDTDGAGTSGCSFNCLQVENDSKVAHDLHFQETQSLVNQQILSQLTAISDRLQKLEGKPSKKTNDKSKIKGTRAEKLTKSTSINKAQSTQAEQSTSATITDCCGKPNTSHIPSLEYIRANNEIQCSVEERIKELQQITKTGSSDQKIKSQRGGQIDVFVKIGLNGPMNMPWRVPKKKGSHTTN